MVCYYQMASGSLLNALGLQHWNVVISVGAELCQVILMYRWCAFPWLGIYGYLIAMLFTGIAAFALNFMILYRKVGFSLRPLRRFGVPLLCGATLFFWTRIFYQMFSQICHSDIAALVCTVGGVGILYIVVLRLMGIRLFYYLSKRMEKPYLPRLHMW